MALFTIYILTILFVINTATPRPHASSSSLELGYTEELMPPDADADAEATYRDAQIPQIKRRLSTRRYLSTAGGENDSAFEGIGDPSQNVHNITKLTKMLYETIHKLKIRSMVDVPCRGHLHWMGTFLREIKLRKGLTFSYYCVDSSADITMLVETRLPVLSSVMPKYKVLQFWRQDLPPADLVFSWEGLQKMKVNNVAAMLRRVIDNGQHKYLLIGSSSMVRKNDNKPSLNVRRAPFSFSKPQRIFKKLMVEKKQKHGPALIERDLCLYEIANITN